MIKPSDRKQQKNSSEWRQFEQLVARIEADAASLGLTVTSPDRLRCKITGRLREVDASIRARVGTANVLITIECRNRRRREDVTWIEQLAAKKRAIGADRTIAVSSSGFSAEAKAVAQAQGIDLRRLSDVSVADINNLLHLDYVLFTHKRCAPARVGVRLFRSLDWTLPNLDDIDFTLPHGTDPFLHIFRNTETGYTWSLNDLWLQVQEAADPFRGLAKGQPPIIRTVAFPYPGNVTVETSEGLQQLGDVLLSYAVWLEIEQVNLAAATKVEYASPDIPAIQRIEFSSRLARPESWRISLQIPKDSTDIAELKTGGNWPDHKPSKKKKSNS